MSRATLRIGKGEQSIPGINGPDGNEPVLADSTLVLIVPAGVLVEIKFANDGPRETAVMIHQKTDKVLGNWSVQARSGNGGGKNYNAISIAPSDSEEIYAISGWNKPPSNDPSTTPWRQSYCRRNEHDDLMLRHGILFGPAFDDGSGDEFKEPRLLIKCGQ